MRLLLAALLTLAASVGSGLAADLKILSAGAYKSAAQAIAADFEKKTGNHVTIETDTAGGLGKRIAAGEYFDIVVMPPLSAAASILALSPPSDVRCTTSSPSVRISNTAIRPR